MTAKDLPGSEPDVAYTYDNLGRLTGASQSGHALTFTYDALGRNLTQVGPQGTVTSTFDLAGRRTRITHPDTFYVDQDHLVTGEVSAIRENGATSGVGVLGTYAYDNLGRRTILTRGNGNTTGYSYDAVSRLSQLANDLSGTGGDLTLGFTYNPASEIVSNTRSNDAFSFVPANVNRTDTVNGRNQLTATGSTSTTHDARGNITSDGAITFAYNSESRLTSASGATRYSGGTTLTYDPLGRLYSDVSWVLPHRVYDGDQQIAQYEPDGDLIARAVFGPGTDEPLMSVIYGTRLFYIADERGSVIATANSSGALSSWDGVSPAINTYDEYGFSTGDADTAFQYTGQGWVAAIADGIYYYKNRFYHAGLVRFLQPDPTGYEAGMNLYGYVGGNPINFTDPSGLAMTRAECRAAQEAAIALGHDPIVCGDRGGQGSPIIWSPRLDIDPSIFEPYVGEVILTYRGPCSGSVRAEGVNLTAILGLGMTISVGRVTVDSSGEGGWFLSAGLGAGLEAGVSGFLTRYKDLSSFQGYAESYNVSAPALGRTMGYSRSYDVNGNHTGDTLSGSGFPGLPPIKVGASGPATDTTLLSGECR